MFEFVKNFLNGLNNKGIPVPMLRDHGIASVSFTMLTVSFLNVVYAIDSGKSPDGIKYSLILFGMCGSLYFTKKWPSWKIGNFSFSDAKNKDKVNVE